MVVRTRIFKWFVVCFLAGAWVGLIREVREVNLEVEALGRILSQELALTPDEAARRGEAVQEVLARYRGMMGFERVSLIDLRGRTLGRSPNPAEEKEGGAPHGVLLSARTDVRDVRTGRVVAHLLVRKPMGGGRMAQSALLGLAAGLAAALGFWALIGRRRRAEGPPPA